MSAPSHEPDEPATDKTRLVHYLESGCKPASEWRIGTEHEKLAYRLQDYRPLPYDGPQGIRAVLQGLTRFGWEPVFEDGKLIALADGGNGSVTLEPGGQVELSGAPLENIHQTCCEIGGHLRQVKTIGAELNVGFLGIGYQPKWRREELPFMPKGRYDIMRRYMPKKGSLGLDMMQATCTVQVNLDFDSEATMVRMFRIGLALQPIATALFANSPFREGKPSGFQSFRSHIWTDTDPDRTGIASFVFEDGFGFERYVDWMLDVPMYFVYRDGRYIDASGRSFRDFMQGKLPAYPGHTPGMGDWTDHLNTAFPEVRLKKFLEMRGADSGASDRLCALPALWVGLLYDDVSLDAAWDLCKAWTMEEREQLRADVPKAALKARFRGRPVQDLALQVLEIARAGLKRRARLDKQGRDETRFLDPLHVIAETGRCPAEDKLALYHGRWGGNVDPAFREFAYWDADPRVPVPVAC